MGQSIANKAVDLLKKGQVIIEEIFFNKIIATVITINKDNEVNEHDLIVWRDGHYSCTCTNFSFSKTQNLYLWEENTRIKPECKHALAVKLSPEYKQWIRMVIVPTDEGYVLRNIEGTEDIKIKSEEESIKKKILPKVKVMTPQVVKRKIPLELIFGEFDA